MALVRLSRPPSYRNLLGAVAIAIASSTVFFTVTLHVFGLTTALAVLGVCWAWFACALVIGRTRTTSYDTSGHRLVVSWRNPCLGVRRNEFPLERFGSVLSCSPYGLTKTVVCLMERAADRGLIVDSFANVYKPKSFWDLRPVLVDADDARELRMRLSSLLGVADRGYIGVRLPVKSSQQEEASQGNG